MTWREQLPVWAFLAVIAVCAFAMGSVYGATYDDRAGRGELRCNRLTELRGEIQGDPAHGTRLAWACAPVDQQAVKLPNGA